MDNGALKRYAFINAKLRSKISLMLHDDQIDQLLRCHSLEELLNALKGTYYEPLIALYDNSGDTQRLEAYLFSRSVELHVQVISLLEPTQALVIAALTRKLEVENLKGVLRLWFSNRIKGQNIDYRFGYLYQENIIETIDYQSIINASSFSVIQKNLSHTLYYKSLKEYDDDRIRKEGLFELESSLDRLWYANLYQRVRTLPKHDRTLMEHILNRDADLKNIINLVRFGSLYHLSSDDLQSLMLPGGSITKSTEFAQFLKQDLSSRSLQPLIKKFFPSLAKQLRSLEKLTVEEESLHVETYLFQLRKKDFHTMLRGNPFTIGTILAYFFLEERQDKIIRILLHGNVYGWDGSTIREYLR